MVTGMWGKKIGMTQLFEGDKVVPVTAIDLSDWVVTRVKTEDKDNYNAIQIARVKKRHNDKEFSADWLKKPQEYFSSVREIRLKELPEVTPGQPARFYEEWADGSKVDIFGKTRGRGFAGVVKRWGFTGAHAGHSNRMGRRPGAISFMRKQGKVIKGKKMPGQMGNVTRVMRNLDLVKLEKDGRVIFVKGSIPGHKGSLVYVRKA